jgi:TonB family protein
MVSGEGRSGEVSGQVSGFGITFVFHERQKESDMKGDLRARRMWVGCLAIAAIALAAFGVSAQEARKVISHPEPAYPDMAKELRLTGTVKIEVVIGTDGQIKNTKVLGGNPVFAEAAMEALKKWKYAPANMETTTTLVFNFRP